MTSAQQCCTFIQYKENCIQALAVIRWGFFYGVKKMKRSTGRPKGSTRERLQLRDAVKKSLDSLTARALQGDLKSQELLLEVTSRSPDLMARVCL